MSGGIYLGCHGFGAPVTPLNYSGERHLVLLGPNGSGKSSGVLIPNLLSLKDRSLVVIDPKGELTATTADYRRTLGDVVILNPFNALDLGGAGFNPLASLDPDSPNFVDDASALGEALIRIDEKDPHWTESAQGLLVALIMWEVKKAKKFRRLPKLENVRFMLTEPSVWKKDENNHKFPVKGFALTVRQMCRDGGPVLESLAGRFNRDTPEMWSIQSTADTQTRWLLSPPMKDSLVRDEVDFRKLKKKVTTVYLILPAERMQTHSVWLRLVITSALRALFTPGGVRTLFMLEEFAQLGHLNAIENALGYARGYGIQLWPILQDLNQLKTLYKTRWESFLANAGVVQGFAPNDLTTAEWMSKRTGTTTVVAASFNQNDASSGRSYGQVKRPLALPQELMSMSARQGLMWTVNSANSIPFTAPHYEEFDVYYDRANDNPYAAPADDAA